MRTVIRWMTPIVGSVLMLCWAAPVSAASIIVTPATVVVGGTVTVSGDVLAPGGQPGCQVPGTVTLISGAFAGQGSFMHQDVETTAGADGRFSVQAQILPGVAPAIYTITGRCGGGNLGVQATLVVTAAALPSTGSAGVQRVPHAAPFAGAAAVLLTLSAAALVLAERRAKRLA